MGPAPLGWLGIVRLGLVQTGLGAVVVLTTSTLNRVMVVEAALPAAIPGLLVGLHYALQTSRPRLGYGSDVGGRRTPWIVGGMAVLCAGAVLAAVATAMMLDDRPAGIALAVLAFTLIGLGVGAAGTTLLVLLAKRTAEERRPVAATVVWVMMIFGFIVTSAAVGHALDPFTPARLVAAATAVAGAAFCITLFAVWGIEQAGAKPGSALPEPAREKQPSFREAFAEVWRERESRRFAVFVFVSMIAFSAQDLILEPFAGVAFGYTPGESTKLSGVQNSGVLIGMLLVAAAAHGIRGRRFGSLRGWTVAGCLMSAAALGGLVMAGIAGPPWPLRLSVFLLGFANGIYAVAAIGSMMTLVDKGRRSREGVRMGIWGAAQAIAFGLGGVTGAAASDVARLAIGSPSMAYATVFAAEAAMFLVAAVLALRIGVAVRAPRAGSDFGMASGMRPARAELD